MLQSKFNLQGTTAVEFLIEQCRRKREACEEGNSLKIIGVTLIQCGWLVSNRHRIQCNFLVQVQTETSCACVRACVYVRALSANRGWNFKGTTGGCS